MGQASSHPERRPVDDDHRPRRSVSTSLRGVLSRRSADRHPADGLHDGLLRSAEPRSWRTRSLASNRLSQLFRPMDHDAVEPVPAEPERQEPARSSALQRTRSRFHEMLRRDSGRVSPRPSHAFLQHRTSYVHSGPDSVDGDDFFPPPRLPSIDLSSTFDHETFPPHSSEPEVPAPRAEPSTRRSNLPRLNALRPDRPFRHLTSSLRRRRSPQPSVSSLRPHAGDDQASMMSTLLSVAAAATAATLMGDDPNAFAEARSLMGSTGFGDLGGAGEDGSFDGFLRALRNGRIASALRQGHGDAEPDGSGPQPAPLNFFRMFRFGASGTASNQEPQGPAVSGAAGDSSGSEGRMVPIIIVGIRSINQNSSSNTGTPDENLPPFIDALGNFPTPLPAHALGTHGHDSIDSILRPPQNGTSFRHRRRASMGGFGMGRSRLSDRMDDQRDHRSPDRRRERPWSVASSSSNHYEPRPPPATPASPSPELSRISSRNSTPSHSRPQSLVANSVRDFSTDSRRNSMLHRSSAASPLSSHTEETGSIRSTHSGTGLLGDSEPYRVHRRSDTAPNIHYPRFASGHPRRNGVVEPDNLPPLSRSPSNGTDSTSNDNRNSGTDSRSWIIYVLGGSYPENHPILTTPSLFTENPTYEDMMLLSALLGPAKAPVATDEDVQSAGGVYNIESTEISDDAAKTAALVATAVDGVDRVTLDAGQRCLVCLCDFEAEEVARKLVKCNHLFHKDCIDVWLTTGRNSCPLCRQQGVDEKTAEDDTSAEGTEEETAAGAEIPTIGQLESVHS